MTNRQNERTDVGTNYPTTEELSETSRGGRNLRDLMTPNPATVTRNDDIRRAASLMVECDCGAIPVVDGDRVIGMITDRDIVVRTIATGRNPMDAKVSDAMSENVVTCRESDSEEDVLRKLSENQIRRIPVVDENDRIVGMIAQADLAREGNKDQKVGQMVEEISQPTREERRV